MTGGDEDGASPYYFPYAFEGEVVHHDLGTMRYTAIFLPADLAAELPFDVNPRLRATGEVNDVAFAAAWQPSRGRWYMMLSKKLLREAGLSVGDMAEVRFRVEPADSVDEQPDIARALAADPALATAWDSLTPGRRRGWTHRVASATGAATRLKRVAELTAALSGGPDPFTRRG
ncbi:MAG TPA: YdeI/OmpD-associated family protein [Sphingomonas sp.]|jgi:hypothetical protein